MRNNFDDSIASMENNDTIWIDENELKWMSRLAISNKSVYCAMFNVTICFISSGYGTPHHATYMYMLCYIACITYNEQASQ